MRWLGYLEGFRSTVRRSPNRTAVRNHDGRGPFDRELDGHCQAHDGLTDFRCPRPYGFVDELPRTATGTLVRGEVEAMLEA